MKTKVLELPTFTKFPPKLKKLPKKRKFDRTAIRNAKRKSA